MRGFVTGALVFTFAASVVLAQPAPDPDIKALTDAVTKLAAVLERQASQRAEEQEARRVDVAASILTLRYRKIERLDAESESIDRDEENSRTSLELMKKNIEQYESQSRTEAGQIPPEAKQAIEQMQLQLKLEEERLVKQRERGALLQAEAESERRRLAGLEAILEDWLEHQTAPRR